jgi:hypothetical protein
MADFINAIAKLTVPAAIPPPGQVIALGPALAQDDTLQTALDAAVTTIKGEITNNNDADPEGFSFAVADLTDDAAETPGFGPTKPAYAGFHDTQILSIASLAKLLPLYAAHLVRANARDLVSQLDAADPAKTDMTALGSKLRDQYKRANAADSVFPMIKDILTFDANGGIDFKTGGDHWPPSALISDSQLDSSGPEDPQPTEASVRAGLTDIAFREQLRLMARWSNDASATIVIRSIGFLFLWWVTTKAGLFRSDGWDILTGPKKGETRDGRSGLFLGIGYSPGHFWPTKERPPGAPVLDKKPQQRGNARAVTQLMVSLVNDLLDDEARISMREMLRKASDFGQPSDGAEGSPELNGTTVSDGCPIGKGLNNAGWTAIQQRWAFDPIPAATTTYGKALRSGELACSKIGYVNATDPILTVSANAVLMRSERSAAAGGARKTVTAVLVGLANDAKNENPAILEKYLLRFGELMGAALIDRHKLTP